MQRPVVEISPQRHHNSQAPPGIGRGRQQSVQKLRAISLILDQRKQLLELVDQQNQLAPAWTGIVSGQDALDGPQQATFVFPHLTEQTLRRIDRDPQQRGFQLFQRPRAGQHLDHEPALRTGQAPATQCGYQAGPDHARFAAAAGAHYHQKAGHPIAF